MDRCIWWKIAGWYLGVFGWKSIHSQLLVFEQMSDNSCISKAGYMPNWLSLCPKCSTMVADMRLKRIVNIYCKTIKSPIGQFQVPMCITLACNILCHLSTHGNMETVFRHICLKQTFMICHCMLCVRCLVTFVWSFCLSKKMKKIKTIPDVLASGPQT